MVNRENFGAVKFCLIRYRELHRSTALLPQVSCTSVLI